MKRHGVSLRRIMILAVVSAIAALAMVACGSTEGSAGNGGDLIIKPAPIHNVAISIAEAFPPQVFVQIEGGLSDGCTELHEVTTERKGNTIVISVTTERPRDAICTQVYGTFTENVALGNGFASGETYTVNVSEVVKAFVM